MLEQPQDTAHDQAEAQAPAGPAPRRQKTGKVISNKMEKTVVVSVESLRKHRLYKHTVRVTKHFKAHDERNECRLGDTVRIEETRPISKEKRWRVLEIIAHDIRATDPTNAPAAVAARI